MFTTMESYSIEKLEEDLESFCLSVPWNEYQTSLGCHFHTCSLWNIEQRKLPMWRWAVVNGCFAQRALYTNLAIGKEL